MSSADPMAALDQLRPGDLLDLLKLHSERNSVYEVALRQASPNTAAVEALVYGKIQASQSLVVAGDAFDSLRRELRHIGLYSIAALVRIILESSAIASWVADPQASVDERVERSHRLRYRDCIDELQFYRELVDEPVVGSRAKLLIESLQLEIEIHAAAGYAVKSPPTYVKLARQQFGASAAYRLLSGVAHGRPWAQEDVQSTLVSAVQGDVDRLANRIIGHLQHGTNWLVWAANDYAEYVAPSLRTHVKLVAEKWGATPRPPRSMSATA